MAKSKSKTHSKKTHWGLILLGLILLTSLIGTTWYYRNYYYNYDIPTLPHSLIAQLTGKNAVNDSEPYDVKGTDLGIIVQYNNTFRYIFGDTFGGEYTNVNENAGKDVHWRSNVMAISNDSNFSDGISINSWVNNNVSTAAVELIGSRKIDNLEMTCIPTGAVVLNNTFYIYYMSVNHWGNSGDWKCNNASIAVSTDGIHFAKIDTISWIGDGKCVQFAPVQDFTGPLSTDSYQYFIATPSGRNGAPHLLRCLKTNLLNKASYEYLVGRTTAGDPIWNADVSKSIRLFKGAVGEASVMWNTYLQKYLVVYFDKIQSQILVRTAAHLWDTWSTAGAIATASEYPALYGGFVHPKLVENDGQSIYFIMSQWGPYNSFVMKADVSSFKGN